MAGKVSSLELCAAPSVMATISTQESVNRLRATAAALGSTGYQWGEFLPPPTPLPERRLPNGQLVADHRHPGRNLLTIDNGTERDAVVALVQAGNTIVSVYATSGNKATVRKISDGGYELYETTGVDWDP